MKFQEFQDNWEPCKYYNKNGVRKIYSQCNGKVKNEIRASTVCSEQQQVIEHPQTLWMDDKH